MDEVSGAPAVGETKIGGEEEKGERERERLG